MTLQAGNFGADTPDRLSSPDSPNSFRASYLLHWRNVVGWDTAYIYSRAIDLKLLDADNPLLAGLSTKISRPPAVHCSGSSCNHCSGEEIPTSAWRRRTPLEKWSYSSRPIIGDVDSPSSRRQVGERLRHCLENHSLCSKSRNHIRPRRLVEIPPDGQYVYLRELDPTRGDPYIALSYVWGETGSRIRTTLGTLARYKEGIRFTDLPKTIQDAVLVARRLEVRFIWIDSLCIIQDSGDELAKEIADMAHYYGNAILTISAAGSSSCSDGFLRTTKTKQPPAPYRSGPFRFGIVLDIVAGTQGSINLVQVDPRDQEPIDMRAWALQEGLLSTRLL
jgi:hypothetical protein